MHEVSVFQGTYWCCMCHASQLAPPEIPVGRSLQHSDVHAQLNTNEGIRRQYTIQSALWSETRCHSPAHVWGTVCHCQAKRIVEEA